MSDRRDHIGVLSTRLPQWARRNQLPSDDGVHRILVAALPPWPPPRRIVIARVPVANATGNVDLVGHSDGHIELQVREAGILSAWHLARITRSNDPRRCIISITKREDEVPHLYLNGGEPLKLLSASGAEEVDIAVRDDDEAVDRSYETSTAGEICAERMALRRERMAEIEARKVRPGRRRKTPKDELSDLEAAIARLSIDLDGARHGVESSVRGVAGGIRALTYWPNDKPTWNPLLLRLATRLELPLPVYVEPPGVSPGGLPSPDQHVQNLLVSCRRLVSTFVLVDLEEFLDRTLETLDTGARVTVGEAVAYVGSAERAHYDPDVAEYADRLRALEYLEVGALSRMTVGLGGAVLELARWIAMRFRQSL